MKFSVLIQCAIKIKFWIISLFTRAVVEQGITPGADYEGSVGKIDNFLVCQDN